MSHSNSTEFLQMPSACTYFPFHLGIRRGHGLSHCLQIALRYGMSLRKFFLSSSLLRVSRQAWGIKSLPSLKRKMRCSMNPRSDLRTFYDYAFTIAFRGRWSCKHFIIVTQQLRSTIDAVECSYEQNLRWSIESYRRDNSLQFLMFVWENPTHEGRR